MKAREFYIKEELEKGATIYQVENILDDMEPIFGLMEDFASIQCKESEKKAYIDGTNACHKAFQPLLKSALKAQREICANRAMLKENEAGEDIIDTELIRNSPEPK